VSRVRDFSCSRCGKTNCSNCTTLKFVGIPCRPWRFAISITKATGFSPIRSHLRKPLPAAAGRQIPPLQKTRNQLNTTHKASLYDKNGVVQSLIVSIPDGSRGPAGPTGIIFNLTSDFVISSGGNSSKAVFVWATDAGTIAAWSPKVLPTQAVTAFDDQAGGAIYKGLTVASVNG